MTEIRPINLDLCYSDLEDRYGKDYAEALLRTLEQFEGIRSDWVLHMSPEARLENVISQMSESMKYQTRH